MAQMLAGDRTERWGTQDTKGAMIWTIKATNQPTKYSYRDFKE